MEEVIERIQKLLLIPECRDKKYKIAPIPDELWQQMGKECYLCQGKTTLPHHIIPDGTSTKDNIVPLCNGCHLLVHKLLSQYKGYRKAISYYYSPYG